MLVQKLSKGLEFNTKAKKKRGCCDCLLGVECLTTTRLKLGCVNDEVDRAVGGARVLNVLQIFDIYRTASFTVDFSSQCSSVRILCNYTFPPERSLLASLT